MIQALAKINDTSKILEAIPVSSSQEIPISLINHVLQTQEAIVISNPISNLSNQFVLDSYIIEKKPQSILCIPIINQGRLIAILYLENSLVAEAFTKDRVEILNLLCSQTAISIENANFYKTFVKKNQRLQPTITITTKLISEKSVQIGIADNGIGIPEEVKTKLFDPFFTTKPVGKGTGLGLSNSYQTIVHSHKGRLWCESTPLLGSCFLIEIPINLNSPPTE